MSAEKRYSLHRTGVLRTSFPSLGGLASSGSDEKSHQSCHNYSRESQQYPLDFEENRGSSLWCRNLVSCHIFCSSPNAFHRTLTFFFHTIRSENRKTQCPLISTCFVTTREATPSSFVSLREREMPMSSSSTTSSPSITYFSPSGPAIALGVESHSQEQR